MKQTTFIFTFLLLSFGLQAQPPDSLAGERFSIHAQTTIIKQFKPAFKVKYSGDNSLSADPESQTSLTATLYAGARLWKGASVFINPEIAGGSGLSSALGVAAATNGETFRIGDPAPKIYLARLFFRQIFSLSAQTVYQESDFNQLGQKLPVKYFACTIGKISVSDFFDDNKFSHDPRTQFMSWGLMANGAWDYAANTRGYTPSIVLEFVSPEHELRYNISLLPVSANANELNWDISKVNSHNLEYTHNHRIHNKNGAVRFLGFFNTANMGNYLESVVLNPMNPDIKQTRRYGNTKYGFGINAQQDITNNLGCFFRASYNDGNNETWAFTEIDRSISAGICLNGLGWKRENDNIGLAHVRSGISGPHQKYLKASGQGFMLGDGNLNYAWEQLSELYYCAELVKNHIFMTGTYQFVLNPGYNKDRKGPVNVFSVRIHTRI